jgi:hypothetical protein
MNQALLLLDRALEMGQRELAHLRAGEVEQAEELAFSRGELTDEALADGCLSEPPCATLDSLVQKLLELKDLQASIIEEAKTLQKSISAQIQRTGQEEKRQSGYGKAARPPRRIQSLFVSRDS